MQTPKEWKIDEVSFKEALKTVQPNNTPIQFYSQQDEDKYLLQFAIGNRLIPDGTFLELGACDGVLYSNTKMLQDHFGFTGVLIEPVPRLFNDLEKNRGPNAKCYNYAISNSGEDSVQFIGNNPCAGIVDTINEGALQYVDSRTPYQVASTSLANVVSKSGFKYIDFMIVDVEGGEMNVLQSMDWEKTPVFTVIVEAHSKEYETNKRVFDYLTSQGFVFKERQRGNHVFVNQRYVRKNYFLESFTAI